MNSRYKHIRYKHISVRVIYKHIFVQKKRCMGGVQNVLDNATKCALSDHISLMWHYLDSEDTKVSSMKVVTFP